MLVIEFDHYILRYLRLPVSMHCAPSEVEHTVFAFKSTCTSEGGRLTRQLLSDCSRATSACIAGFLAGGAISVYVKLSFLTCHCCEQPSRMSSFSHTMEASCAQCLVPIHGKQPCTASRGSRVERPIGQLFMPLHPPENLNPRLWLITHEVHTTMLDITRAKSRSSFMPCSLVTCTYASC